MHIRFSNRMPVRKAIIAQEWKAITDTDSADNFPGSRPRGSNEPTEDSSSRS